MCKKVCDQYQCCEHSITRTTKPITKPYRELLNGKRSDKSKELVKVKQSIG
jgi:hypothetical protein